MALLHGGDVAPLGGDPGLPADGLNRVEDGLVGGFSAAGVLLASMDVVADEVAATGANTFDACNFSSAGIGSPRNWQNHASHSSFLTGSWARQDMWAAPACFDLRFLASGQSGSSWSGMSCCRMEWPGSPHPCSRWRCKCVCVRFCVFSAGGFAGGLNFGRLKVDNFFDCGWALFGNRVAGKGPRGSQCILNTG